MFLNQLFKRLFEEMVRTHARRVVAMIINNLV